MPTAGDGPSQQVGGDVNGSDGHSVEGMGLGHSGRLVHQLWGLNRVKVSPYHININCIVLSYLTISGLVVSSEPSGGGEPGGLQSELACPVQEN